MRLKRDIYSHFNSKIKYGNAGDEVRIVAEVIVEGPDGNRFTVNGADLVEKLEEGILSKPEAAAGKKGSKKQNSQPSLF